MPKIEVYQEALFAYAGRSYTDHELEAIFPAAKAELDEPVNEEGIVKIELNDTNRPDLWSAAGLARLLRVYQGSIQPDYSGFLSTPQVSKDAAHRQIMVESSAAQVRPYVVAFAAKGPAITESVLNDLIQTQEKLCRGYGQKRKTVAMGIYRSSLIQYPVKYFGANPDTTSFQPLGMDETLSLREILVQHPKGQEYGHIVADASVFPFLTDSTGQVLSFPPVINSAKIGAVEVGDSELFIELTGTELHTLFISANIVACDMADMGFEIFPVSVHYPENYPAALDYGRIVTTPFRFQQNQQVTVEQVNKLLGTDMARQEIVDAIERMGNKVSGINPLIVELPPYRNDYLHPVDVIEDVMIGRGMDSFAPEMPRDFTVGRLTEAEETGRRVKSLMVGLGYQEMIFNYLSSAKDYIYRMDPQMMSLMESLEEGQTLDQLIQDPRVVKIMNPMSENFEYVRPSILPSLLSAESVSGNAAYPHHIFEVGKTVVTDETENYGSRTMNTLGFLSADGTAGFNQISSVFAALAYYMDWEYQSAEVEDKRFIPGRCVQVVMGPSSTPVGIFGEIHPGILENWGITVPCSACEVDLDKILELLK
jgi:phenylalanyl-tRNA synthetase beta chain